MKPHSILTLSLALFVFGRAVAAEPWPEIPSPPKARVEWVGDDMRVNGVPTRVMQFQSKVGRAEVVEYYRAYWTGGYTTKPSIKPLGPAASVISQRHGPYFMTVKVEDSPQGASHGLISVAQVAGSKVSLDPGELPLIPGGHVISVVESHDPGKRSREVVVLASQPPTSLAQFYQTSFVNEGWLEVSSTENPRAPGAPAGSIEVFAKDHSEMQLSIVAMPQGRGSALVANLVTKDTGTDAR